MSESTSTLRPCSANQERYIKASLTSANSYFLPLTFLVDIPIDTERLLSAIGSVISAEPALNVVFGLSGEHFSCQELGQVPLEQDIEPGYTAMEELPGLIDRFIYGAANIIGGAICRVHIARLAPAGEQTAVTIALHHAVADAISLGLFMDRVSQRYSAIAAPDELAGQEDYFSLCERHGLMPGDWAEAQRDYWCTALGRVADETSSLPLFSGAEPGVKGQRACVQTDLTAEEIRAVEVAAARAGVTLFEFVFAAYLATLARQTGRKAACATFQSSGRHGKPDMQGVIGEFSNALPVFADIRPEEGFDALARSVRAGVRAGLQNEKVPYDEIIRATGFHPRFGINWYPGTEALVIDGHAYPAQHLVQWQSDYDLNLHCIRVGSGLRLDLSHPVGSSRAERAGVVLDQLRALLARVAADGATQLPHVRLPSPALEAAVAKPEASETLWQRFAQMAEQQPGSEAITDGKRRTTYGELRKSADLAADRLAREGVGAGTRLAIQVDRGPSLVIVVLAAIRLGAVFALHDPAYPAARVERMNQVFRPEFIIDEPTQPGDARLLEGIGLRTMPDGAGAAPLPLRTSYVLFTSGTTGLPKCVATAQQGLLSFVDWHIKEHGFGPASRFAMLGGIGHDPILRDIFTPLLCGGTICVPPANFREDPRGLFDWFARERISVVHLTPQMGKLLAMGWRSGKQRLDDLRHVFWGGDKLRQEQAQALFAVAPHAQGAVFYGLSETPQAAAAHRIDKTVPWQDAPIGKGVNGRRVSVVRDGHDAAYGEVGEIVIEASDLFLGYYDAASGMSRTAVGPIRSLHTGDVGFFLPSGDIAIVGRRDDQVKVRGYRVELGDIAAQLQKQPGVDQAVALVEPGADGESLLLAYVTPVNGAGLSPSLLMAACRQQLPSYMVPHELFVLDALPLTVNGKLDKARLPRHGSQQGADDIVEPETEVELAVAREVQEALGLRAASMALSVQELGADSLSYLNLMLGLEKVIGTLPPDWDKLPLRELAVAGGGRSWLTPVETPVLMRAVSIVAVVLGHFGFISFGGATSALFFIAGHSFGRFQISSILREKSTKSIFKIIGQIALPTLLVMLVVQFSHNRFKPITWIFLGNFLDPHKNSNLHFWFVDILIQVLLILALLFSFHRVREAVKKYPFEAAFCFTVFSFLIGIVVNLSWDTRQVWDQILTSKMWLIGIGWCLARSSTPRQRVIVVLLVLALLGIEWLMGREAQPVTLLAFAVILLVDRVRLPRPVSKAVVLCAAASLFIYLMHFRVQAVIRRIHDTPHLNLASAIGGVVFGIVFYLVWDKYVRKASRLV